jgi:signal transduction histidine kinase
MKPLRFAPTRMLSIAGLFTWACVGVPMISGVWYFDEAGGIDRFDQNAWRVAFFTFGACYLVLSNRLGVGRVRALDIVLLGLLTLSSLGVSQFSDSGLGSILLMVVSGVLPWLLRLPFGIGWMVLQHAAVVPIFAARPDYELLDALLQSALYVGFSSFVFVTSLVARQQAEARDEQRRLNSELRATRALLAESSRLNERMRISRELHDLLGHHLTALSLNLEVASHVTTGKAQEHVRQAQSLAKLLLTDVREAVSQLREDDAIDLREALEALVEGVPGLAIDFRTPETLQVADPARAQVILRCAQEIITNTVRHAGATRLRLEVQPEGSGVFIRSQDDGQGADAVAVGNGLRGMRERLEHYGGRLAITTARGEGFAVNAWLPLGRSESA